MATNSNYLWNDRKRILGLPISFTKYKLSEDRLFIDIGLISSNEDQILLYKIRDINLKITLFQRIFNVGTIIIYSADRSSPILQVKSIKNPKEIKELIHVNVEKMRHSNNVRSNDLFNENDEPDFEANNY